MNEIGKNALRLGLAAIGGAIILMHQFTGGDGESMLMAGILIGAPVGSYLESKIVTKA